MRTDADRSTLDRYARATAQSWANYTGEIHYLSRVGINLFVMTDADFALRIEHGLPERVVSETYAPMINGWYATSLGAV